MNAELSPRPPPPTALLTDFSCPVEDPVEKTSGNHDVVEDSDIEEVEGDSDGDQQDDDSDSDFVPESASSSRLG